MMQDIVFYKMHGSGNDFIPACADILLSWG